MNQFLFAHTGAGILPPLEINLEGEAVFIGIIGAVPSRPPKFTLPLFLPYTGITLTAVVLLFTKSEAKRS